MPARYICGMNHANDEKNASTPDALPPKISEQLLLDVWPQLATGTSLKRVLATSLGRAQFARSIAEQLPEAEVVASYLDLHMLQLADEAIGAARPDKLQLICEADFSLHDVELAALPLSAQGDGELARDQLQQANLALGDGGLLLASTDNPDDRWLGEVLEAFNGRIRRIADQRGVVYAFTRTGPPRRVRDYSSEFKFRDGERLFDVVSRPGVFSHRRIDPGARRLIDAMQIMPGERVFDIGCGWGAVGLAAAARHDDVYVEAIDSNARAVQCARTNADQNLIGNLLVSRLEAEGRSTSPGSFDVALANPPYYANFRIAELFTAAAFDALRPGGKLWMVTKFADWYAENLPTRFDDLRIEPIKGYVVVNGRKRRR